MANPPTQTPNGVGGPADHGVGLSCAWNREEEEYLRDLSRLCDELCQKFKVYHDLYKSRQAKFRIPSIIISSITGLASFGNSNFPVEYQNLVNIGVGACSIFIAILNSIESYMKIGEIIGGTLQASINFQKLKETIDVELSLPMENRTCQGIIFLRQSYQHYEKYWDLAPNILRRMRFIKPTGGVPISATPTRAQQLTGRMSGLLGGGSKNNTSSGGVLGITPTPDNYRPTLTSTLDTTPTPVEYRAIQISLDK